jgi:hypothetical protein
MDISSFPGGNGAHVTLAARLQLTEQKFCRCEHGVFTRTRGYANSQRSQLCRAGNPHAVRETPLHSPISIWCAVPRMPIVGPLTSEDTLNFEYEKNFPIHLVSLLERYEKHCWFPRGAATSSTKSATTTFTARVL